MASQETRDASFNGSVFRQNFKRIIAKRSDLVKFMGGRLIAAGAGLTVSYAAGTVLGIVTATGRFKTYNSGNSDGSEVPVGVLAEETVADEFDNGTEVSVIHGGQVLQDALVGLDSNAKTLLKGRSIVEHGTNIFDF